MGEEEEEERIRPKGKAGTAPQIVPGVAHDIHHFKGIGQALPASERAFFEPRFGKDFSSVRVHTDDCAARTAQSINARAFTLGNNVVFGQNQYEPTSRQGRHLLAHELTHVVQQTGAATYRALNARKITPVRQSIQRKVSPRLCRQSRLVKQTKCDLIDSDNFLAMYYIAQAMAGLRASKYSTRVKKALKCYFNIANYQHKKTLLKNLQLIQAWLSIYKTMFLYEKGYPVGCKTKPSGKPVAYARPGTWSKGRIIAYGPIGICPIYFKLGQPRRVRTLIHEQAHVVGFTPRSGAKELRVGSKRRKRLPPAKLLKSADGYAHFAMAVGTGKFTGC